MILCFKLVVLDTIAAKLAPYNAWWKHSHLIEQELVCATEKVPEYEAMQEDLKMEHDYLGHIWSCSTIKHHANI